MIQLNTNSLNQRNQFNLTREVTDIEKEKETKGKKQEKINMEKRRKKKKERQNSKKKKKRIKKRKKKKLQEYQQLYPSITRKNSQHWYSNNLQVPFH